MRHPDWTHYLHTQEDWPQFRWNRESLSGRLASVRHEQGRLLGRMEALGSKLRQGTVLPTLTEDGFKSSEIERENLDAEQVRSSIARRLGMDIGGPKAVDRNVEGVVEMMLDATRHVLPSRRRMDWPGIDRTKRGTNELYNHFRNLRLTMKTGAVTVFSSVYVTHH